MTGTTRPIHAREAGMSAFAFEGGVGYHAGSPMRGLDGLWRMYQIWTVARAGRRGTHD